MKRISKIVLIIGIALLYNNIYAQKGTWTIGLYTGVQGQVLTSCSEEYRNGSIINNGFREAPYISYKHAFSNIPPVELNVKYNIKNRFSFNEYRTPYLNF